VIKYIKVTDSKAYFATHFIHVGVTDEIREKINLQVEKTGIVCYSVDELVKAKQTLDELGVNYTIEELRVDPALIAKAQGVKYLTPGEVKKHLLEDAEPESMIIPNLKKKLQEKEEKIVQLTNELNLLKQKHTLFEERIGRLERVKGVV
jgi:hypothetical protein